MGITIVVLGNYLPKTRNNKNIGFRLPWTQYNDNTWNKSNRFGSYVLMIAGVISANSSLFVKGILAAFLSVGSLLIALPITIVYAYIVYREEKRKDDEGIHKR